MKILLAPLNWGLGHASRCIPLVQRFLNEGHEVVLGGDGDSLTLLRKHFPKLRYVYLAPLNLRYSKGSRQVFAMLRALPQLIAWSLKDHALLQAVLREEHFDRIISDNRFGLYTVHRTPYTIYITHQLHIMLPRGWRWLEPLAERLHARIYRHYNEVWIPDFEDPALSLAGDLSHPKKAISLQPSVFRYIGPLSRFEITGSRDHEITVHRTPYTVHHYDVVAVLSGLEPHRTLLEREIIRRYSNDHRPPTNPPSVLIVQGLMSRPNTRIKRGNITIVPHLSDEELIPALLGAKHIIARSGYSTIMDLHALELLQAPITNDQSSIELIPTPGQPEQEYLAYDLWLHSRKF